MKKILIPILTTAAMAPVVATSVACSCATGMPFEKNVEEVDEPGFVMRDFDVKADEIYEFKIDFKKFLPTYCKDFRKLLLLWVR